RALVTLAHFAGQSFSLSVTQLPSGLHAFTSAVSMQSGSSGAQSVQRSPQDLPAQGSSRSLESPLGRSSAGSGAGGGDPVGLLHAAASAESSARRRKRMEFCAARNAP